MISPSRFWGEDKLNGTRTRDSRQQLQVAIASSGRFHLLDLAREFDALGIDVRFYSFVPRRRAAKFGLPGHCHVALLPFLFPLVACQRLFPQFLPRVVEQLTCWALDLLVILRMRRCDLFICMSGMYLQAPQFAKWRYNAQIVLHRGSRHILSQRDILARIPQAQQVTSYIVRRELLGYDIADRIEVPSTQVVESFTFSPGHSRKLFLSPYGVDLKQFPLRKCALPSDPTVLFVGKWSYQKGVDVLVKAIKAMDNVRLIHVGAIGDAPFPNHFQFVHHDHIPQWQLTKFYHMAHVFALASRQDGLAVVLCQALASGLRVVCTEMTGGSDLSRLHGLARLISVVPVDNPEALRHALAQALEDATGKTGVAPITDSEREALSWRGYALRNLHSLSELLPNRSLGRLSR